MEELCPKCNSLLLIVECCGGGIWFCEKCNEYYYYGEIIEDPTTQSLELGGSEEENEPQP